MSLAGDKEFHIPHCIATVFVLYKKVPFWSSNQMSSNRMSLRDLLSRYLVVSGPDSIIFSTVLCFELSLVKKLSCWDFSYLEIGFIQCYIIDLDPPATDSGNQKSLIVWCMFPKSKWKLHIAHRDIKKINFSKIVAVAVRFSKYGKHALIHILYLCA